MKVMWKILAGSCLTAVLPCALITVSLESRWMPEVAKPPKSSSIPRRHLLTAYSHGCTMPGPGKKEIRRPAANGQWPVADETVAADWIYYVPGSVILIEDLGVRIVTDKGGRIKKNRVDMFMSDCPAAKRFGIKRKNVDLLNPILYAE